MAARHHCKTAASMPAIDGTGSYAMPIGANGYIDFSGQVTNQLSTNRSGLFTGTTYFHQANGQPDPRAATTSRDVSRALGMPTSFQAIFSANSAIRIAPTAELYSTATYGHRNVSVAEGYHSAADDVVVRSIYPNGVLPFITMTEDDFEVDNGVRGWDLARFSWDAYVNYGRDLQSYRTIHSDNPTFGAASQTDFNDGTDISSELTSGLQLSRHFDVGFLPKPLALSFGAEYRHDTFQVTGGDYQSWANGGDAILDGPDAGKAAAAGAAAHAGNPPLAVSDSARDIFDAKANLDMYLTQKWEMTAGGHVVNYAQIATVETGSIGTRYNLTKRIALRANFNVGYRPPTLGQLNYFYSSPAAGVSSDQLPNSSAGARALGAGSLKGQYSRSFSVGIDADPVDHWHIEANLYTIGINDRLADTSTFSGSSVLAILAASGLNNVSSASYYANPVNTQTYGGDISSSYLWDTHRCGQFNFNLGVNFTDTEITHFNKTPATLQKMGLVYFNEAAQDNLLHSTPKNQETVTVDWKFRKFSVSLQEKRYGSLTYIGSTSLPSSLWTRIQPAFITNLEVGYDILKNWHVAIGGNNLFNHYPEKLTTAASAPASGLYKYPFYSPYGYNGGFYYVKASVKF